MSKTLLYTFAALLITTPVLAAPPAPPAPAKPAAAKPATPRAPAKPRSAKSVACSTEADGKNLHGAARSAYMRKCSKSA